MQSKKKGETATRGLTLNRFGLGIFPNQRFSRAWIQGGLGPT